MGNSRKLQKNKKKLELVYLTCKEDVVLIPTHNPEKKTVSDKARSNSLNGSKEVRFSDDKKVEDDKEKPAWVFLSTCLVS